MNAHHYTNVRQKSHLSQLDSEAKLTAVLPKSREKAKSVLAKAAQLLKEAQYATI